MLTALGVGYVGSSLYITLCKEDIKNKFELFMGHTVNQTTLVSAYLGTYFILQRVEPLF
jgi:hypothetical protein